MFGAFRFPEFESGQGRILQILEVFITSAADDLNETWLFLYIPGDCP